VWHHQRTTPKGQAESLSILSFTDRFAMRHQYTAALRFLSSNPRKSLNLRFGSKDRRGAVQRSVTWKPTWTSARSTRGHYGRAVAEGLGKPASYRNRGQRQMHESDCAVSRDGGSISLTLQNKDGKQCEVVLTFDEASSL